MPKLVCRCSNIIDLGRIPNPCEWLYISDVEYDSFEGAIDAEDLYMAMKGAVKCDQCGRLWLFHNGYDAPPLCYKPEDDPKDGSVK